MNERKKSGTKSRYPEGRRELHLKFSPELMTYIDESSREIGYQAYFEKLVEEQRNADNRPPRDEEAVPMLVGFAAALRTK